MSLFSCNYQLGVNVFATVNVQSWDNCSIEISGSGDMYYSAEQFTYLGCNDFSVIGPSIMGKSFDKWSTCCSSCSGTLTIPDDITSISGGFMKITDDYVGDLEVINIGKDVIDIGDSAFENHYSDVEFINISPDAQIKSLGARCFYGNNKVKNIDFNGSVTDIGAYCFYNCESLETVTLSVNLGTLYAQTFGNCYKLRHFNSGNTINYIDESAFVLGVFAHCYNLLIVTIKDTVQFPSSGVNYLMPVELHEGYVLDPEGYLMTTIYTDNPQAINRDWKGLDNRAVTFESIPSFIFIADRGTWVMIRIYLNVDDNVLQFRINDNGTWRSVLLHEDDGTGSNHIAIAYNKKWYWVDEIK